MIYCVYDTKTIKYFIEYLESIAKHYPLTLIMSLEKINIQEDDVIWLLQYLTPSNIAIYSKYPEKTYLINFEQNSRSDHKLILSSYSANLPIIDYSLENIRLIPRDLYYYIPYMVNPDEIYDLLKKENMIVVGCGSRRKIIADKLNTTWLNDTFGKERDTIIFKHKILINIHYSSEFNVLEELRVNRCIYNKMIVITEKSGNLDYYDLKDYIIECDYNDIVKVAKDVLENYDYYYNKLFKNFDIIQQSINRKAIADRVMTMSNDR